MPSATDILDIMAPAEHGTIAKLLSIAQIITFIVTAIYVVANTNAATQNLRDTVYLLRDSYTQMSERLIKLETRFEDEQRKERERDRETR
jgi:ABC-type transporter lipoprotein component MlaA